MPCNKFKCIYDIDGTCDSMDCECIGDLCEGYGDCSSCQRISDPNCCRDDVEGES